jgi:hypothetical protein
MSPLYDEGGDCEINLELNCFGEPPIYILEVLPTDECKAHEPGDFNDCSIEAWYVRCCEEYGAGTFMLRFTVEVQSLPCCQDEFGGPHLFDITLTNDCPTREECAGGGAAALMASSLRTRQPSLPRDPVDVSGLPSDVLDWLS